jgi:hypothetical protein
LFIILTYAKTLLEIGGISYASLYGATSDVHKPSWGSSVSAFEVPQRQNLSQGFECMEFILEEI